MKKFSTFFTEFPEKILGKIVNTTNQYGQMVEIVKGDLSELQKIDVSPSLEPQIRETAELVDLDAMKNIQAALAKTAIEQNEPKTPKVVDVSKSNLYLAPVPDQDLFTPDEAFDFLNPGIETNDVEVWIYYCLDQNRPVHPYLITRFQKTYSEAWFKQQMKDGFLCFDYESGKYVPRVIYYAGNIAEKISLTKNSTLEEPFLKSEQKERQLAQLELIKPEMLRVTGEVSKRLILDPMSKFCKEFVLSTDETIFKAFQQFVSDIGEELKITDLRSYTIAYTILTGDRLPNYYSKEEKQEVKLKAAKEIPHLMNLFLESLDFVDQQKIEFVWNYENNSFVDPNYNQVPLMFVINKTFKNKPLSIRPEQREGVAFNEINGTGVLGFDVGVGKTLTAILTVAQFLQSGRCKRPIFVVPKPTYHKWIGEIRGIFDESGVLQGTGILPQIQINSFFNFGVNIVRNETIEVVDHSLTILSYQGAKRLGFSDDFGIEFKQKLNLIMDQVGDDISERAREKYLAKTETLVSEGKFNGEVLMDEMGFDYMCMDEAHNANKIFMSVKGSVREDGKQESSRFGFSGGGQPSMLGKKMFFLSQFVQSNSNGLGNVQLLTATPFTNNPLNVYNIFALTNFDRLKYYGIENVNTFFEKYVEVTIEKTVNSRGELVEKEIIKSWKNKVALQKILFGIINYKGAKDSPSVKRPNKIILPLLSENENGILKPLPSDKQILTILAPTERQKANKTEISNWLKMASSDMELSKQAPYLVADSMASKNTLSPYIYEGINPDSITPEDFIEDSPKLNAMMKVIKGINDWFDERKAPRSCQIIYSAQGIEYFPLIKRYMIERLGYKEKVVQYEKNKWFDEVEILAGDKIDDDMKEDLKAAFNAGKVKIIIGSSTIREGIDLQTRTSTLHNLWADWNPTDQKQLEGRLWRFGNMFDYVRIISYLVQGGSDMFKYQKLEEKTARINDIFDRLNKDNILDVSDEDREAVKWALIDDINEIVKDQIKMKVAEKEKQIKIVDSYIENYKEFETDLKKLDDLKTQVINYAKLAKTANDVLQLDFNDKDDLEVLKIVNRNANLIQSSALSYSNKTELTSWKIGNTMRELKTIEQKVKRLNDYVQTTKNTTIFELNIPVEIELLEEQKKKLEFEISEIKSDSNYQRIYDEIDSARNKELSQSATPEIVSKRILSLNDTVLKVISVEDELTKPDPTIKAPKQKITKEEMKKQFAEAGSKAAEKIDQEIKSKLENDKPHTQKLIDSLVKYGERKIGDETINSEGVKYRYDTVKYKNKTVPNWLNVLFERASKELTGKSFFSQFKYEKSPEKEYTFYIRRPSSKVLPNEDASFSELVILDNVNKKYSKAAEKIVETGIIPEGFEDLEEEELYDEIESIEKPTEIPLQEIIGKKGWNPGITVKAIDTKYTDNPIFFTQYDPSKLAFSAKVTVLGQKPNERDVNLYENVIEAKKQGYKWLYKNAGKYSNIYVLVRDLDEVRNTGYVLTEYGLDNIRKNKEKVEQIRNNVRLNENIETSGSTKQQIEEAIQEGIEALNSTLEFVSGNEKQEIESAIEALKLTLEFV